MTTNPCLQMVGATEISYEILLNYIASYKRHVMQITNTWYMTLQIIMHHMPVYQDFPFFELNILSLFSRFFSNRQWYWSSFEMTMIHCFADNKKTCYSIIMRWQRTIICYTSYEQKPFHKAAKAQCHQMINRLGKTKSNNQSMQWNPQPS